MHTRSNAQISETASVSRDFSDFFERHFEDVARALAICLGDTQMAADCAQEAMVRAYQRFDEVRMFENPAGWLFRVGLNLGRSRFRRLRSELLGLARDEPVSDPDPLPPSVVSVLRALPLEQRTVIVMRFYFDLTAEQVADVLGIPLGTVKSRQHRALRRLQNEREERNHHDV